MAYILIIDYKKNVADDRIDAERKRIDYAIHRHNNRVKKEVVGKPSGVVLYYSGEYLEDFLDDLYPRLENGKDAVKIFKPENVTRKEIKESRMALKYGFIDTIDFKSTDHFITFIATIFGSSITEVGGEKDKNSTRSFTAYTRKGKADVVFYISNNSRKGYNIDVAISGFGEVVSHVGTKIEANLNGFLQKKCQREMT